MTVPIVDGGLIGRLRADLLAANWTVDSVAELLGETASAALVREQRVPALIRLRDDSSPAAQLTKAFILGATVDLAGVFPSLGVDGAKALGLIDEQLAPQVDMRPHSATLPTGTHGWWVVSDRCEMQTGEPLQPEHVLGIGPATLSLLRMTVREPVGVALDLGTGCGIQALYLATHAKRVIATDLSERACAYARFNAALNDANIEVRQGSLFDPVENERFDLITSNPPFVITPASLRSGAKWEYRDGGMDRDDLIQKVVSEGPGYLNPGGTLQMLANWEIPAGEDWSSPMLKWVDMAAVNLVGGLRAWVVLRDRLDAARYAELWLRDSGGNLQGRQRWEADYELWVTDFHESDVEEIAMGFLVVQRTDEPGVLIEASEISQGDFPDGLAVTAALNNVSLPASWEQGVLIRSSDVREVRYYVPGQGDPELIQLTQGAGMGRSFTVGSSVAALVGAADGEMTIGQVMGALTVLTDRSSEQVRAEVLAQLPQVLQAGMVSFKN